MTDPAALPQATVDTLRRFRIPLVWIIPLVALLIGLFLAARSYYEQGPLITITFKTGDASITLKKDGTITIQGRDIAIKGSGKVSVKASGEVAIKGMKIASN